MGGAHCDALGQVDGRTTAHGDDAVALVAAVLGHRFTHGVFVGIGGRGIENARCVVCTEGRNHLVDDAGAAHSQIGDDQGPGDAGALGFSGQVLQAVIAELNLGDVIDQGHDSPQVIQDCYCRAGFRTKSLVRPGANPLHCLAVRRTIGASWRAPILTTFNTSITFS